jgi:cell division protein FtsL
LGQRPIQTKEGYDHIMRGSTARKLHEDDHHIQSDRLASKPPAGVPERRKKKRQRRLRQQKNQPSLYNQATQGSKNMPSILKRGHIYFLVENEASQYRIPKGIIVSVVLIFACAMCIVLTHAQITSMERQISRYERELQVVTDHRSTLEAQLMNRFSLERIEYLATTRLGMIHPDPSQIIEIYVPRQNVVRLNRSDELLPRENYFWNDIRTFAGGIVDRIFGRS